MLKVLVGFQITNPTLLGLVNNIILKVGVVGFIVVLTLRADLSGTGNAKTQWVFSSMLNPSNV